MTINRSRMGYGMSDEMAQRTVNDRPEEEKARQAEAQQEDQQVQVSQASAAICSLP
jgi:hypothetical protein